MFIKWFNSFSKKEHWIAVASGWIFNWFALMLSYKENPLFLFSNPDGTNNIMTLDDPTSILGTGGFPLKAFDYPYTMFGGNAEQSTVPFLINFAIWIIVSYLLINVFRRFLPKYLYNWVSGGAIIMTFVGTIYLIFKFDD